MENLRDPVLHHSVVTGAPAPTAFVTLKDQRGLGHIEIRQQVVVLQHVTNKMKTVQKDRLQRLYDKLNLKSIFWSNFSFMRFIHLSEVLSPYHTST